jgi:hypothetical protein
MMLVPFKGHNCHLTNSPATSRHTIYELPYESASRYLFLST